MARHQRMLRLCWVLIFPLLMILGFHHQVLFADEDQGTVVSDDSPIPDNQPVVEAGDHATTPAADHEAVVGLLLPRKRISQLSRQEQRGKVVYEYYCALCHGLTGDGDGFNAYSLSIPPAKHSNASYMHTLSDAHIGEIIRNGGVAKERSPLMPPWGNILNDDEISYIIGYIRTLTASE